MGAFRILYAIGRVTVGAGFTLVKGTVNTLSDTCRMAHRLSNKDWEGAAEIVGTRIERTVFGMSSAIDNTLDLAQEACEAKASGKSFLREENIERMTNVATLGVAASIGLQLFDADDSVTSSSESLNEPLGEVASVMQFDASCDTALAQAHGLDPAAVHNGVFVGNQQDLVALIRAGEDPHGVHVEAEHIDRSDAVRNEFLVMRGLTEVPDGYELHHIKPLSEGGTDTPDNMIIVRDDVHDQITAAHRAYYQWN